MSAVGKTPIISMAGIPAFTGLDSASIATGGAWLEGQLEKLRTEVIKPLNNVNYPRDIPFEMGGGFAEYTSSNFVNYADSSANQWGLIEGSTNAIGTISANRTKDVWKNYLWAKCLRVPFVDQEKWAMVGQSLQETLKDGLQISWDKMIEQNTYLGFSDYGTYGLLNNPNVTASLAPASAQSGNPRNWCNATTGAPTTKTAQEILADINNVIYATQVASEYDIEGIADRIILPPIQFNYISTTYALIAGVPLAITIKEFLEKNNVAALNGKELKIVSDRHCIGIGLPLTSGGAKTNRMIAYSKNKKFVRLDILQPLTKVFTQPVAEQIGWLTPYIGNVSQIQFLAYQPVAYLDGI